MCRTGMRSHGCACSLVLFPLFIYVVATTFLLEVDGSEASPSQREIEEAQKIVGRFLRDEAGTNWLSGLAKRNSAPLTAENLASAILNATKPEGKVWRAASTIKRALKAQTSGKIEPGGIMGNILNWKDLVEDIENEDDIICLYRKNSEQTAGQAEDWRTFFKTVTPGYAVHLAIDTGLKYVICLKKIEVPEVDSAETSTSPGTVSTTVAATFLREPATTKSSSGPMTSEKLTKFAQLALKKHRNNGNPNIESEESEESCDGSAETEDNKRNIIDNSNELFGSNANANNGNYDFDESSRDKDSKGTSKRRVNEDFEDFSRRRNGSSYPPMNTQRRPFFQPSRSCDCNRPIIVVMRDGSLPLGYRPQYSLREGAQRSLVPLKLPSIPRTFVPRAQPPRSSFDPFQSANESPQFTKLYNSPMPMRGYSGFIYRGGPKKVLSTTTHFAHALPREKIRLAKLATTNAIGQTSPSAFVPNSIDTKPPGDQFLWQRPDAESPRYPVFNSFPWRVDRVSIPNARNTAIPIRESSKLPEWHQLRERTRNSGSNIRNAAIPIYEQPRLSLRGQKTRTRTFPSGFQPESMKDFHRQSFINRGRSQLAPRIPNYKQIAPFDSSTTIQKSVVQPSRPLIYGGSSAQKTSNMYQRLPVRFPLSPKRNIDPAKFERGNPLRLDRTPRILPNPRANYLPTKNFLQTQRSQFVPGPFLSSIRPKSLIRNPSWLTPGANFYSLRGNEPFVANSAKPYHHPASCCSPCDEPIQLQIVVQGQVQEPLRVSVLTDHSRRVEIVGSERPMMAHGTRPVQGGNLPRAASSEKTEKDKILEVAQIGRRIYDSEEVPEKNEIQVPVIGSVSSESKEFAKEESSGEQTGTGATTIERAMENASTREIGEDTYPEMTTVSSFGWHVNGTMFTTTNYTVVGD